MHAHGRPLLKQSASKWTVNISTVEGERMTDKAGWQNERQVCYLLCNLDLKSQKQRQFQLPPPFSQWVKKGKKEKFKNLKFKLKNSLEHTSVSLTAGMWTAEMVNFSRLRRHNHHTNVLGFATGPSGAQLPSTDIRSHIFSRQNFLFKRTFPSYSKVVLRKILLCRKNINKKK